MWPPVTGVGASRLTHFWWFYGLQLHVLCVQFQQSHLFASIIVVSVHFVLPPFYNCKKLSNSLLWRLAALMWLFYVRVSACTLLCTASAWLHLMWSKCENVIQLNFKEKMENSSTAVFCGVLVSLGFLLNPWKAQSKRSFRAHKK